MTGEQWERVLKVVGIVASAAAVLIFAPAEVLLKVVPFVCMVVLAAWILG